MLIDDLMGARDGDPFANLGLIPNKEINGFTLRAWLPYASKVVAKDIGNTRVIKELECKSKEGLFEAEFPNTDKPFHYSFDVSYPDAVVNVIDPYQFHDEAYTGLAEMKLKASNLYRTLGAHLMTIEVDGVKVSGVKFAVYAPSAKCCSVIGDFNFWDGRRHPMERSLDGHWVLFVPGIKPGDRYKYELKDPLGNRLPHKADPVGFYSEQYPSFASIVVDQTTYTWHDADWIKSQLNNKVDQPISIYEMHFASWKRKDDGYSYSYRRWPMSLSPTSRSSATPMSSSCPSPSSRSTDPGDISL